MGSIRKKGTDFLAGSVVTGQGEMVSNSEGRLRLGITFFFMVREVKHGNKLPREVVVAPFLETFEVL